MSACGDMKKALCHGAASQNGWNDQPFMDGWRTTKNCWPYYTFRIPVPAKHPLAISRVRDERSDGVAHAQLIRIVRQSDDGGTTECHGEARRRAEARRGAEARREGAKRLGNALYSVPKRRHEATWHAQQQQQHTKHIGHEATPWLA